MKWQELISKRKHLRMISPRKTCSNPFNRVSVKKLSASWLKTNNSWRNGKMKENKIGSLIEKFERRKLLDSCILKIEKLKFIKISYIKSSIFIRRIWSMVLKNFRKIWPNSVLSRTYPSKKPLSAKKKKPEFLQGRSKTSAMLRQWIRSKKQKTTTNLLEKKGKGEIEKCKLIKRKFKRDLMVRKKKRTCWRSCWPSNRRNRMQPIQDWDTRNARILW